MDIKSVIANEDTRRKIYPVCATKTFLAHAAVCPLPQPVAAAMSEYLAQATQDNQEAVGLGQVVEETRTLAAQLLEVRPAEIAFVGSTSMGLALVASGLDWRPGDNVVCYRDDYPANVYPWLNLATRGVEVRFIEPAQLGRITMEDVERTINDRTRLVALASAHFVAGWRLPVDDIGRLLHDRDILFCLDGIQTLGALRTSCRYVDFAAADAHKWLLGPIGTAVLFVREQHFARLRPALVGWASAACPGFVAQDELAFWNHARRYECGSLNTTGIVGLRAALQLLTEAGIDKVENRVLDLAELTVAHAVRHEWQILGPTQRGEMTGIVSVTREGVDLDALHRELMAQGLVTSLRQRRDGNKTLRVSAHFYNTEAEIEQLFDQL